MIEGTSSSIIGSTYPSTDEDIYETENAYAALEAGLNRQINNMESTHPGYDEYWYQVDELSHNPYHLISYFTAKYGEFTYEQVKDEVEEIFRETVQPVCGRSQRYGDGDKNRACRGIPGTGGDEWVL